MRSSFCDPVGHDNFSDCKSECKRQQAHGEACEDVGNHLSLETVFTAPATPVAPVAMSVPESVVDSVTVTVPFLSVTVVLTVAQEEIPSAIVMMLTCFSFIFFDVLFSVMR